MNQPSLQLIVLRTAHVEQALAFYQALGVQFEQHQHGTGAVHYASTLGGMVLELYPQRHGDDTTHAVRIGFAVDDLAATVARLAANSGRSVFAPHESLWECTPCWPIPMNIGWSLLTMQRASKRVGMYRYAWLRLGCEAAELKHIHVFSSQKSVLCCFFCRDELNKRPQRSIN